MLQLTFRHWPHLIFTRFSESRMMLDTTLTLFSSESIIDRLSAAETAIELLFRGTWFVRLEVSRCKGNGIWIECPCCSFWWSFWKVYFVFLFRFAAVVVAMSISLRVCEGEGVRGRETKIRKFKNKKKFDLQKVKNREREEKKIASCRQTRSISMFFNVTSFSYKYRSQSPADIESNRRMTFFWHSVQA